MYITCLDLEGVLVPEIWIAFSEVSGIPVVLSTNLIEATWDTGAYVQTSGVLKRIAVKLSKICNDLRLLSSGPRTGINEINLPRLQPGSSIMPGKVNPVIPEVVSQVAFDIIGKDVTITLAAEAGQLPTPQELAQSGQLANFSFGQGGLLASPVQIAAMMNTIASGGVYRTPFFVCGSVDETDGTPLETLAHPQSRRVMSAENAALLRKMLQQVVEEGTAQDAAGLEEGAGGKTGTAQTGQFTPDGTERKNLWFAGFYPAQQPRYTIVVLQDGQVSTEHSSAAIFARLCAMLDLLA